MMNLRSSCLVFLLAFAILSTESLSAQLADHGIESLPGGVPILEETGFSGTVLIYDLRADRLQATNPSLADARRIPASTFKIANSLIALETGLLVDEHTVIAWDSVVRPRTELSRDLDLAEAFRLSALPHFQSLARAAGSDRMSHYVNLLEYGNRDLSGGIDQFWVAGGLRISPREQLEFLIRLYTDDLPLSPTTMATVRRVMFREEWPGGALSAKTGWARLPDGHEVGWWVGWVEKGSDVLFFASMIESDDPGADFGRARTGVARAILEDQGILPHAD